MRILLARFLVLVAMAEGALAIPLRLADATFLGIEGGGYLFASVPTLLLAIFFILDDLRDGMKRPYGR
ncbi:MAG: hypothetical protein C4534_08780 [Gaiellales bacterium]|nr:MAG: hypothetical protein C4534_08780 [Gaiellales bacterium]